MKEEDYHKAYFNLACRIVQYCFEIPCGCGKEYSRFIRTDFANKGKILKLFCDCSDNFEYEKLRKRIVKCSKHKEWYQNNGFIRNH